MVVSKKRGLSPIVATVLLIALAMVLAMIIFIWARGWIFEQIEKKGSPIDQVCESVKIKVDWVKGLGKVTIVVVNEGPVGIGSLEIRQEGSDSSIPSVWNVSVPSLGTSGEKEILLGAGVDSLIIYPQLLGNIKGKQDNRVTTCLNSGQVIDLE